MSQNDTPAQGASASLRDAVDRIIVSAMAWQPSENGPSYDGKFHELMARFDAAFRSPAGSTLVHRIEAEARRYAEMYPQSSDGRNTFVIFADWIKKQGELR